MNTLTTEQAAQRLGIEPPTVRRWVMKGWLRPVLPRSKPLVFLELDVERAYAMRAMPAERHKRIDDAWARLLDAG